MLLRPPAYTLFPYTTLFRSSHLRFTRDIANITMDVNGTERIDFNALGGADHITVNDLTGTDVTQVSLDDHTPSLQSTSDVASRPLTDTKTNHADQIQVVGAG